jgi:hypothetical protein
MQAGAHSSFCFFVLEQWKDSSFQNLQQAGEREREKELSYMSVPLSIQHKSHLE